MLQCREQGPLRRLTAHCTWDSIAAAGTSGTCASVHVGMGTQPPTSDEIRTGYQEQETEASDGYWLHNSLPAAPQMCEGPHSQHFQSSIDCRICITDVRSEGCTCNATSCTRRKAVRSICRGTTWQQSMDDCTAAIAHDMFSCVLNTMTCNCMEIWRSPLLLTAADGFQLYRLGLSVSASWPTCCGQAILCEAYTYLAKSHPGTRRPNMHIRACQLCSLTG